jgi:hypothetical protein
MTAVFFGLLLSSLALSVFTLSVFGRHVGESAARYRVSFQPDGRAFSIWWLIYSTTFAASLVGLALHAEVERAALLLWSGTWVLTAIWVLLFDNQRQLVLASLVLLGAFGTSLAALFLQQAWPSQTGEQTLLFAPLSLLSGWLLVASSVGLGTALTCSEPSFGEIKADNEVSLRVYEDATRDAIFARRKEATTTQVVMVVILAFVGGCLALAIPDPLFVWPIVWAVILQRGFPRSCWMWLALAILVAGCVVSIVRVFVWEF